jgi:hypothetical protein
MAMSVMEHRGKGQVACRWPYGTSRGFAGRPLAEPDEGSGRAKCRWRSNDGRHADTHAQDGKGKATSESPATSTQGACAALDGSLELRLCVSRISAREKDTVAPAVVGLPVNGG